MDYLCESDLVDKVQLAQQVLSEASDYSYSNSNDLLEAKQYFNNTLEILLACKGIKVGDTLNNTDGFSYRIEEPLANDYKGLLWHYQYILKQFPIKESHPNRKFSVIDGKVEWLVEEEPVKKDRILSLLDNEEVNEIRVYCNESTHNLAESLACDLIDSITNKHIILSTIKVIKVDEVSTSLIAEGEYYDGLSEDEDSWADYMLINQESGYHSKIVMYDQESKTITVVLC